MFIFNTLLHRMSKALTIWPVEINSMKSEKECGLWKLAPSKGNAW